MSKVVALLQDRITEANTLDLQKEMLAYHSSFDSYEVYKLLFPPLQNEFLHLLRLEFDIIFE